MCLKLCVGAWRGMSLEIVVMYTQGDQDGMLEWMGDTKINKKAFVIVLFLDTVPGLALPSHGAG